MGDGPTWEKARKMQLKMSKTRSHVQSRILEITNQLAPPLDENISIMHQTPATELSPLSAGSEITSTSRESTSTMQNQGQNIKQVLLPSYEDSMSQNPSQPPPPYTLSESTSFQPEPIEVNLSSNEMKRSATADSVGNSVQGEILFRMEGVQVSYNYWLIPLIVMSPLGVSCDCQWRGEHSFLSGDSSSGKVSTGEEQYWGKASSCIY